MTAHLSRRTLLGAVPSLAAPMALLPASVVEAAAETPIRRLYREHVALKAALDGSEGLSDFAFQAGMDAMHDMEERMAAEPVTSVADLAIKVLLLTALDGMGEGPHDEGVRAECRAFAEGRAFA